MRKATGIKFAAVLSLLIGLVCGTAFSGPIGHGSGTPDKALYTDYWGVSQEIQGTIDTIVFTQSKPTVTGDPYHNYPYYIPEGSRIVSYNMKSKQLKVLTEGFNSAFDPCTSWDGSKFLFAGSKSGKNVQIWEINIDGSGLRQLTDVKGVCRTPIYYPAASIEDGKGNVVWRDRYFEGDWTIHGQIEKVGMVMLSFAPAGVLDEYYKPGVFNTYRLDFGKTMQRVTGHVLNGRPECTWESLGTVMAQVTFNMSSNFDLWLTPDGNIMFAGTQANGARADGKGRVAIMVDNWDGWYPRHIYGNYPDQQKTKRKIGAKCAVDGRIYYIETDNLRHGVGSLVSVSWRSPYASTYRKESVDDGGQYRSPYPVPDGRIMVSYAERGNFGLYWFDQSTGKPGKLVYDDPEWNDHQPAPVYTKYKPRWINTFSDGQNFGVTAVTYQPFDQVNVEGYPHSWATWICFDTTITDMPIGPYPEERTKPLKHGDVKAVRIIEGLPCTEPNSARFAIGVGSHLLGGERTSSNSGTMFGQRRIIGYQNVYDDGSVVTSQTADTPYYIQILDDKGMSVQTLLSWSYVRPYGERICIGCHDGSYGGRAYRNIHAKALYNWWFSDLSHYDSPFAYAYLRLDKDGNYAGTRHGEDIVVPNDVYYGGASGTTSVPVEGLREEFRRTIDFRRDIQPIIDSKCASCHNASTAPNLGGGLSLVTVDGKAAFSQAYTSLLASMKGKDPNLGGRYINPSSAINSLLVWRLYEDALSNYGAKNPFPKAGRVLHDNLLTIEERYAFVEWIDLGAQWDNIQGPDNLPGYGK
ncbi:MAG: hydrazine synthase subunit alpha [Candidatus Anammoxibacter sp.]